MCEKAVKDRIRPRIVELHAGFVDVAVRTRYRRVADWMRCTNLHNAPKPDAS
jgi:hypothetical protein